MPVTRLTGSSGNPLSNKTIRFYANSVMIDQKVTDIPEQQQQCEPIIRTGIGALDQVILCIFNYGITIIVPIVALFLLLIFTT